VATATVVCPDCGAHLPTLLRDVLASGTLLRDDAYRIDYALGQGGFGITYRAMNVSLEQVVAIKEFYPREHVHRETESRRVGVPPSKQDAFAKGLDRFIREGRTLARLRHPGIVTVHNLFKEFGTAYLVMELVAGRTLRDELDAAGGRLAPARVTEIMEKLVDALAAVHDAHIAHLDLKPDNIILTPDGRVVLIDFGACKQDVTAHTHSTTRAFTTEYAPPELIAGLEVGPESDLYEVGVMLQEMLTATRPPVGLFRVTKDEWTLPTGLGEPWARLLTSALRVQRADRPKSIRAWWAGEEAPAPEGSDPRGHGDPWAPEIHVPFDLDRPGAVAPAKKAAEPAIEIDFGGGPRTPPPAAAPAEPVIEIPFGSVDAPPPAKKAPAEPEIVVPFHEERTPPRRAVARPAPRPAPVKQYSAQLNGWVLALLSAGTLWLTWLTFQHYVLRVGGGPNLFGGIVWAVVMLVVLLIGIGCGLTTIAFTTKKVVLRALATLIVMWGIPALGLIARGMFPGNIWSAWWLLYGVGFGVFIAAAALGPTNESASG